MSILLDFLTLVLIGVSVFLVFLVLMQPAKSDGGMGSALGGGMAESVLGGSHSTVISKLTIKMTIAFFVLSFVLYLGNVYQRAHANSGNMALPNVTALPAHVAPVPAAQPMAPITIQTAPVVATQPAAAGAKTTTPAAAPTKP
jgi:preprotein translocase subunit SecG